MRSWPFAGLRALTLILVLAKFAGAQGETTSAIVGQVSDQSGGALPGAAVALTGEDTGLKRTARTGDSGQFSFPQLKPGTYTVEVSASGFEPQKKTVTHGRSGPNASSGFRSKSDQRPRGCGGWGRSAADQHGQSQHRDDAERERAGEPSESRRRPDLPGPVCAGSADQYGGQLERLRRRAERLRQRRSSTGFPRCRMPTLWTAWKRTTRLRT